MQFKLFDILSIVIPGALVLCVLTLSGVAHLIDPTWIEKKISVYKDVSTIITVIFVVLSYLSGYIVHAFGSWMEPVLFKTWGGHPTYILFMGRTARIGLGAEKDTILNWLKSKSTDQRISSSENSQLHRDDFQRLFQIAKNLAFTLSGPSYKERIEEFNNSYVFSRNILVAFLISLGSLITLSWYDVIPVKWCMFDLLLVLVVWWRARDRAIYYCREIIVAGYYSSRNEHKS